MPFEGRLAPVGSNGPDHRLADAGVKILDRVVTPDTNIRPNGLRSQTRSCIVLALRLRVRGRRARGGIAWQGSA